MKDWGTYRKLFERLDPKFERLPYAARCLAAEVLRRCDRVGKVIPGNEASGRLVEDLAFHVRAHTGEETFIRPALEALLVDGYLVFEDGYLVIRNFANAQRTDSAARMAEKRARDAAFEMDEDTGAEPLDPAKPPTPSSDASDTHQPSDEQASPLHAGASSRLVSSGLSRDLDQSSERPEVSSKQVRARGGAAENKPVPMTSDWLPPDEYLLVLAQKWEVEPARISAEVPEFRWYWVEGKGRGKKSSPRGWLQTFGNRVAKLAELGHLYTERKARQLLNGAPRAGDQLARQLEKIMAGGAQAPSAGRKALP